MLGEPAQSAMMCSSYNSGYACAAKDPAVDAKMRPIFAAVVPGRAVHRAPERSVDHRDHRGPEGSPRQHAGWAYQRADQLRRGTQAGSPIHHRGSQLQHCGALPEPSPYRQAPACPPQLKAVSIAAAGSHPGRVNTPLASSPEMTVGGAGQHADNVIANLRDRVAFHRKQRRQPERCDAFAHARMVGGFSA